MASRITTWDEKTELDGSESLAVDDGGNKKLLLKNLLKRVASGDTATPNLALCDDWNSIDPAAGRCVIASPADTNLPNIIGSSSLTPQGTDIVMSWAADSSYPSGAADVASIMGGYDNVNNQIAGICNGFHCFIQYNSEGHSAILSGSYNWIKGGRGVIVSGRENEIDTNADFAFIGNGDDNDITGSSNYSVIVGGDACSINGGSYGFIGGGNNNTISGVTGSTIAGGDGNTINTSASYSFAVGTGNTVSQTRSCAIGGGHTVTGGYAAALGRDHTISANGGLCSGDANTVSGLNSTAHGDTVTASGEHSIVVGENSVVEGDHAVVMGDGSHGLNENSQTFGKDCNNLWHGTQVNGAKNITLFGDVQNFSFTNGVQTTDNSTTGNMEASSGRYFFMPNNASIKGRVLLQAYDVATGDTASWTIDFAGKKYQNTVTRTYHSGTTAEHDAITVTSVEVNFASWGGVRVAVLGKAATTIKWSARVDGTIVLGTLSDTFTANTGTDQITTATSYQFINGERVQLTTSGTLPAGLSTGTDYYVVGGTNYYGNASFGLSLTPGGSAIDITDTGSGTHTITRV